MTRPRGMTTAMFDSYIRGMFYAGINPEKTSDDTKRVTQTIGNAKASQINGVSIHAKDGEVAGIPFCAAVDLSVRGLTTVQIKKMLQELAKQGYVGWFRNWGGNQHCHVIFVGHYMKRQLQDQAIDFLKDRTGLSGHGEETFWTAPTSLDKPLARMLARSNPQTKKRIPAYLLED